MFFHCPSLRTFSFFPTFFGFFSSKAEEQQVRSRSINKCTILKHLCNFYKCLCAFGTFRSVILLDCWSLGRILAHSAQSSSLPRCLSSSAPAMTHMDSSCAHSEFWCLSGWYLRRSIRFAFVTSAWLKCFFISKKRRHSSKCLALRKPLSSVRSSKSWISFAFRSWWNCSRQLEPPGSPSLGLCTPKQTCAWYLLKYSQLFHSCGSRPGGVLSAASAKFSSASSHSPSFKRRSPRRSESQGSVGIGFLPLAKETMAFNKLRSSECDPTGNAK